MREEPNKLLLDRELYQELIQEPFAGKLSLLEELVNYGTNLVPRCFVSSSKKLPDVVITICLLKQAVTILDSIHVLAAKCATTPCFICLRSLLEVDIGLRWILKEETERRAILYFVWELRKQLHLTRSLKKGTPEHNFDQQLKKDSQFVPELSGVDKKLIDKQISQLKRKLASSECRSVNTEFDQKKKGLRDKKWYVLGGGDSIKRMAKQVRRASVYQHLYAPFSDIVHGQVLDEQVSFENGKVVFEPIRNPLGLDNVFEVTLCLAIDLYRTVLDHYRPSELANFDMKYTRQWQVRFMSEINVKQENGSYNIS